MTPRVAAVAVPLVVLLVAGQVGVTWLSPGLAGRRHTTLEEVIPLIAVLAIPAAIGLAAGMLALRRGIAATPALMILIVAGGLAMRLAWFGVAPPMEDDYYRYLWDGGVLVAGGDPYAVAPQDVPAAARQDPRLRAVATAGADVLAKVHFVELRSIYPGTGQIVFAIAHLVRPFDLDGLRMMFLLADIVALGLLFVLANRLGQTPLTAAFYWLNPMVVYGGIGLAHVDVITVPLVLGAVLLAMSARPVLAGVALGFAAGVKLWPILLAPLLVRQTVERSPVQALVALAVCGLTAGLLTLPLLLTALGPNSGLSAYAANWHMNNAPYAWTSYGLSVLFGESDLVQRTLRAAVALAGVGIALAVAVPKIAGPRDLLVRALIVAAAAFYLSPAQFPWYALWFLPLAAAVPSFPLLAASATLTGYYVLGPGFAYGAAFFHSVPVFLWLAIDAVRARRRP